ncbi:MAG TPA: GlsB/YeaQ/YmgE family stress response membrane protein [Candidatus Saccharimonadales bacterium]|nr:GlsB/YeaQ/YmgE family stress response membrane protein [Candidatus Saccharimonadales bacterium]
MELILYIIFGALVGWIASIIMGRNAQQGAIGNIVVGIVGAIIGGFIMRALGGPGVTGFNLSSFLVALMGAVLLLFLVNMFRRGSRRNTV